MSPVLPVTIPPSRVDRAHRQKPGRPLVMAARNDLREWLVIDPGARLEVVAWMTWGSAMADATQLVAEYRDRAARAEAAA